MCEGTFQLSTLSNAIAVWILIIAVAAATDPQAVGFVRISGLCGAKLLHVNSNKLALAVQSDISAILLNASTSSRDLHVEMTSTSPEFEEHTGNARFSFLVGSTTATISPAVVLQWSSYLADLARRQASTGVFPSLSTLYRTVLTLVVSPDGGAYCNETSNVTLTIVSGACTLEASSPGSDSDQCGPFSCYGFAMVALLCFLILATGIFIYCCTRWRRKAHAPVDNTSDNSSDHPKTMAVNVGGNAQDDDDPFSDFEEDIHPPVADSHVASRQSGTPRVVHPVSPPRGPMAEGEHRNSTPMRDVVVHPQTAPPSSSRNVSPRRTSVVRIREPHETVSSPIASLSLPQALSGANRLPFRSNPTVRGAPQTSSLKIPQPSMDEEKKQLESQPWIWKHVE